MECSTSSSALSAGAPASSITSPQLAETSIKRKLARHSEPYATRFYSTARRTVLSAAFWYSCYIILFIRGSTRYPWVCQRGRTAIGPLVRFPCLQALSSAWRMLKSIYKGQRIHWGKDGAERPRRKHLCVCYGLEVCICTLSSTLKAGLANM